MRSFSTRFSAVSDWPSLALRLSNAHKPLSPTVEKGLGSSTGHTSYLTLANLLVRRPAIITTHWLVRLMSPWVNRGASGALLWQAINLTNFFSYPACFFLSNLLHLWTWKTQAALVRKLSFGS
jgi:hypothetical protein